MLATIRDFGLIPFARNWAAGGPVVPATDLGTFHASRGVTWDTPSPRKLAWLRSWACPLLDPDRPSESNTLTFNLLRPDVRQVTLRADPLVGPPGDPAEEARAVESRAAQLERIGQALYERTRPALAAIVATHVDDRSLKFVHWVAARRLIVGWRTWFGPPYVEAFGRDLLSQVPDRAEKLAGGTVFHSLDATANAVVWSESGVYNSVRAFLRAQHLRPAWPLPQRDFELAVDLGDPG